MHYPSKQQQHNSNNNGDGDDATAAWSSSESNYTKLAATPAAPVKSSHNHATPNQHAAPLPFAVAVENSMYYQAPPPFPPNGAAGTHSCTNTVPSPPPTVRATTTMPTQYQPNTLFWLRRLPLLLLFHACNGVLGIAAFTLVVTLLPLSVGLLPLCCIGVVVFRVLTWTTEWLAKVDVALANLVLGAHDTKLCVHPHMGPAQPSTFTSSNSSGIFSTSVLRNLVFVSSRNLHTMAYFATIKFAAGMLSIIVTACAVGLPVCAIVFAGDSDFKVLYFTYDDRPAGYVLSAIAISVVGLLLMPAAAVRSRQLTKRVCAETAEMCEPVVVGPSTLV